MRKRFFLDIEFENRRLYVLEEAEGDDEQTTVREALEIDTERRKEAYQSGSPKPTKGTTKDHPEAVAGTVETGEAEGGGGRRREAKRAPSIDERQAAIAEVLKNVKKPAEVVEILKGKGVRVSVWEVYKVKQRLKAGGEVHALADAPEVVAGVEITDEVREGVNYCLREGGGTDGVMERYDLDRKQANELIAAVKGFKGVTA